MKKNRLKNSPTDIVVLPFDEKLALSMQMSLLFLGIPNENTTKKSIDKNTFQKTLLLYRLIILLLVFLKCKIFSAFILDIVQTVSFNKIHLLSNETSKLAEIFIDSIVHMFSKNNLYGSM